MKNKMVLLVLMLFALQLACGCTADIASTGSVITSGVQDVSPPSAAAPGSQNDTPRDLLEVPEVDFALNRLFSKTGFVLDAELAWQTSLDAFLAEVPNPEVLDPDSAYFQQERRGEDETGSWLRPLVKMDLNGWGYIFSVTAAFDTKDKLYYGTYGVTMDQAEEQAYKTLLKDILAEVYAQYPSSNMGGKEFIDTIDAVDFTQERLMVLWLSEEDDTFMRLTTSPLGSTYTIGIMVGLQSYFDIDKWLEQ